MTPALRDDGVAGRLDALARELDRTRAELQSLRQDASRRAALFRGTLLVVVAGTLGGLALQHAPARAAEQTVTRLQLPVLFVNSADHTVIELADRPQHHGITMYTAAGEAVFIGFDKQGGGVMQLQSTPGKLSAEAGGDGFKFFNTAGKPVAFIGGDSTGSGVLQLQNPGGGVLVDAGALGGKTGFVQVYPRSGKAPFPTPDYLKGAK